MKLRDFRQSPFKVAVALGNFDGLHIGHQRVIMSAVTYLLPTYVLMINSSFSLLTEEETEKIIESLGSTMLITNFRNIKNLSGEEFVKKILVDKLNAAVVSCGSDFRFGKNASCGIEELKEYCEKYSIEVVVSGLVTAYDGEKISSSRIRKAVAMGDVKSYKAMTGRYFNYTSKVINGDHRGRTLDFPTINQGIDSSLVTMKFGVYASKVEINGVSYNSVTNIGVRPTYSLKVPRSETYIFDYSGNLYGKKINVSLVEFIREEIKFDNSDSLKKQIQSDVVKAKEIMNCSD